MLDHQELESKRRVALILASVKSKTSQEAKIVKIGTKFIIVNIVHVGGHTGKQFSSKTAQSERRVYVPTSEEDSNG